MNWTETFGAVFAGVYFGVLVSVFTLQIIQYIEDKVKEKK